MDKFTFGETPAAQYLVRVLEQLNDKPYSRSVAKRINATGTQVNDLVFAYYQGMPAKTAANSLRLMRLECTTDGVERGKSLYALADQLRRNIQIGAIKRGLRLTSIARKAEKIMENPERRATKRTTQTASGSLAEYVFVDRQSNMWIVAGWKSGDIKFRNTMDPSQVSDKTAATLMEKSDARCKRLRKPHTLS